MSPPPLRGSGRPGPVGLYDPVEEHDACGVGFVATTNGIPCRRVVENAIQALKAVWHRGAVGADGKTGDGAGIHLQIPQDFFKEQVERTGHTPHNGRLAVGVVFLPRTDLAAQEQCRSIVETEILRSGYYIYGWRRVPIDISVIGERAQDTRPEIEQVMIANLSGESDEAFERGLYVTRRRIETQALAAQINDLYICSLSCQSIVYKGLFLAEQLSTFYPDLEDDRFISSYAIYHQRYSTNTFPEWRLAQPFRALAHNGEINTIRGNRNWMRSHETRMASIAFGQRPADVTPIIPSFASDSAALDAVFEVMTQAGRPAPMVKSLLIPEAFSQKSAMPEKLRNMYEYSNSVMEPWDGPAAIVATDGRWIIAGLDRSGLRPLRYTLTTDNLLYVGSETGMVAIDNEDVVEKGRLGPGHMVAVDMENGTFYRDRALKNYLADSRPYSRWVRDFKSFEDIRPDRMPEVEWLGGDELLRRQVAFGISHEDLELILQPMAETGKEAIGSMGDDTPLAVLSTKYRSLAHYFRQSFSQVTNPPIDSLRERRVMGLKTRFGNFGNVLDKDNAQSGVLILDSPVLTTPECEVLCRHWGNAVHRIDCTFDASGGAGALTRALGRIRTEAEQAVREGRSHLFLSDNGVTEDRAAVPMILATGGVHAHLVNKGLRTFTSLNVRSSECMDAHYCAVLVGVGATTVNAWLSEAAIAERHARGLFGELSLDTCIANYKTAVEEGLYKIISKMGISVISSYRGGRNFEAIGLSRALVAEFFPGMPTKISGIGLSGIKRMVLEKHRTSYGGGVPLLPIGGLYAWRGQGEIHSFDGSLIHQLQTAVASGSYKQYKRFARGVKKLPPVALRDLLDFRSRLPSLLPEGVESVTGIRKRFVAPGMSLGALSPEAHETLAIAMNRIGAKSVSGEGGEDPDRSIPRANGDNAASTIKQIASGRFGVTAEYLCSAEEIEIKIAQGSKPGEGGQLLGLKVTDLIARLRHATPGVTLISPPPHHDIYSIEDLAQLIYDLKQINGQARICVKLVSSAGIGTVAAGVAKAHADVIQISGHSGGTGASPMSSIKYAGTPWEIGLAEVNQVLTLNGLRDRVRLRVDGGIKTGRDVVIAAMLGAEEFGIGTASLVAMGCIMVRQCHSNTCPVGVCTQDEVLRAKFGGSPEKVINLFSFIAEDVREILAGLGVRSLDDIVGRTNLLRQVSRGDPHLDDLDLNPLLAQVDASPAGRTCRVEGRNEVPDGLDARMIAHAGAVFERAEKMQLAYTVKNTDRAVGTRFSSLIVKQFGMSGLTPDHVEILLEGSAGQSLGAFAVQGLKLVVEGDANDYVGKGLSGATIALRPMGRSRLEAEKNTIIGNTVLYGATAGRLFAAGQAGERFAVRNSGADAVVEGCGANGCEYMTGGIAVILGQVDDNFGAGMTGGMAFVLDTEDNFHHYVNDDTLGYERIRTDHWEGVLKGLIDEHLAQTRSAQAKRILASWDTYLGKFWQVVPKEIVGRLEHPLFDQEEALDTA
jgi:glutamate synthase (NADPH/NADH) large chain